MTLWTCLSKLERATSRNRVFFSDDLYLRTSILPFNKIRILVLTNKELKVRIGPHGTAWHVDNGTKSKTKEDKPIS